MARRDEVAPAPPRRPITNNARDQQQNKTLPAALGAAGLIGATGTGVYAADKLLGGVLPWTRPPAPGLDAIVNAAAPTSASGGRLGTLFTGPADSGLMTARAVQGIPASSYGTARTAAASTARNAAASLIDDLAGAGAGAAGAAGTNGLLSRLSAARSPWFQGGRWGGTLRSGLPSLGAEVFLQSGLNPTLGENNSTLDSAKDWAIRGAATGAPFGGLGALAGGLIGGAGGAIASALGFGEGPSEDEQLAPFVDTITRITEAANFDENTQQQLAQASAILEASLPKDASTEERSAVLGQIVEMYQRTAMDSVAQRATQPSPEDILAFQAFVSEQMAPYNNALVSQARTAADYYNQLASTLPGPAGEQARQQAHNALSAATRLSSAYQQQALALAPLYQQQQNQSLLNQLAQQQAASGQSGQSFDTLMAGP